MKLKVGMINCNSSYRKPQPNRLEVLLRCMDLNPDLDIFLAPEWYFVTEKGGMYSEREFREIEEIIQRKSFGSDALFIPGSIAWESEGKYQNTALVISNGKTITSYSKMKNGGDCIFAEKQSTEWKKGETIGNFKWRDLSCGLEICADHGMGSLKNADLTDLDLQFIVSCGMNIQRRNLVTKEDRYALICDGHYKKGKVLYTGEKRHFLKNSDKTVLIEKKSKVKFERFELKANKLYH